MKQDVTFWLNHEAAQLPGSPIGIVNTAIEATSLNDRACCRLLDQDAFIRDNITEEDYLIVSVGGNDVALQPLLCTIANMLALVWCGGPECCIHNFGCACPPNTCCLGDLGCKPYSPKL